MSKFFQPINAQGYTYADELTPYTEDEASLILASGEKIQFIPVNNDSSFEPGVFLAGITLAPQKDWLPPVIF